MSNQSNQTYHDDVIDNFETSFSRQIKFIFFLFLQVFSVPASIFVIYHLLKNRSLRQSLPNHVLIVLNFLTLFDIVVYQTNVMIFFRLNHIWPQTYSYCILINYLDFSAYSLCLHLTVWALFERQILIFDPFFCRTQFRRAIVHFSALSAIILYIICFYLAFIVFNTCENDFDYKLSWCGNVCFMKNTKLYFFDWITNGLIPMFLIIILSISLLVRVIQVKYRVHRIVMWRKHRRLSIQLLTISSLYTMCFLPTIFIALVSRAQNDPEYGLRVRTVYLDYLPIVGRNLTPFITIVTLPHLMNRLKALLPHRLGVIRPLI